jgi:hypothetical protein
MAMFHTFPGRPELTRGVNSCFASSRSMKFKILHNHIPWSSPINPPKITSPSPKKRSSPKPSAQTRALPPRPPRWHQPQRHPPARWALARWARWGCQLHGCNGDVNLPKSFECWYFGSDNIQFFVCNSKLKSGLFICFHGNCNRNSNDKSKTVQYIYIRMHTCMSCSNNLCIYIHVYNYVLYLYIYSIYLYRYDIEYKCTYTYMVCPKLLLDITSNHNGYLMGHPTIFGRQGRIIHRRSRHGRHGP